MERFGPADASPAFTPLKDLLPGERLIACKDSSQLLPSQFPYRAIVGTLLYNATWARPDIAFAVSQLARHQERPFFQHWQSATHCLRYLKLTHEVGLTHSGRASSATVTFSKNSGIVQVSPRLS